jgi:cytoskeleton protein RodZ
MSSTPFGEHLRREREMRGVSLEEIAAATRISTRFLEALEKEEWDHLPGGVFNRGFIRSVARFLGLDEESLVAEYALETKGRIDTGVVPDPPIEPSRNWGAAIVSVILLCALIAAGWFVFTRYGAAIAAKLHRKISSVSAAPSAPAAIAPAAGISLELKIAVEKPSTVRVVSDGQTIFDGPLEPGAALQFRASNSLEVTSSESSAIRLELNGQSVPPIGLPGQPGSVTLTPTDLKSAAGGPH